MRMKQDATEKLWAAEGAQSTLAPSLFPDITPVTCVLPALHRCHWEFQALYFLFLMASTSQHCVLSLSLALFVPSSQNHVSYKSGTWLAFHSQWLQDSVQVKSPETGSGRPQPPSGSSAPSCVFSCK